MVYEKIIGSLFYSKNYCEIDCIDLLQMIYFSALLYQTPTSILSLSICILSRDR